MTREVSAKLHIYLEKMSHETDEEAEQRLRTLLDMMQNNVTGFAYQIHDIEHQEI